MHKRKRVNITVPPQLYDKLMGLRKAYGFKSTCSLVLAWLRVLLGETERASTDGVDMSEDDKQYIRRMFAEFGDAQHLTPPDNRQRRLTKTIK